MFLRSIHVVGCMHQPVIPFCGWIICHCTDRPHSVSHSFVDEHSDCFHLLAVVNNVLLNSCVHLCVSMGFCLLGIILDEELLGGIGIPGLTFWGATDCFLDYVFLKVVNICVNVGAWTLAFTCVLGMETPMYVCLRITLSLNISHCDSFCLPCGGRYLLWQEDQCGRSWEEVREISSVFGKCWKGAGSPRIPRIWAHLCSLHPPS